jgi:hypothetical protein
LELIVYIYKHTANMNTPRMNTRSMTLNQRQQPVEKDCFECGCNHAVAWYCWQWYDYGDEDTPESLRRDWVCYNCYNKDVEGFKEGIVRIEITNINNYNTEIVDGELVLTPK